MKKIILLLGDIILLYASLILTLWLRFDRLDTKIWLEHLVPFSIIFAIWLIVFFINGLYEIRKVKNDYKFYGQLIQNLLINAVLALAFFYLILGRFTTLKPQIVLIILLIIFAILFLIWRKVFYTLISSAAWSNNLAIIGVND